MTVGGFGARESTRMLFAPRISVLEGQGWEIPSILRTTSQAGSGQLLPTALTESKPCGAWGVGVKAIAKIDYIDISATERNMSDAPPS